MKNERKFRDDDYDEGYDHRKKKKNKKKTHGRGTGELWADMVSAENPSDSSPAPHERHDRASSQDARPSTGPNFRFDEKSTIEVKGYKIDLSRVKDVVKQETMYNGRKSFGIEFQFMGNKGGGRTIWYGTNFRQRDEEFAQYHGQWKQIVK